MVDGISSRGAIVRLFGVMLVFLGTLNSLLFWRGGTAVSDFYVLLIVSGILLYAVGAIRRRRGNR